VVPVDDRAPHGLEHLERLVRPALDADRLSRVRERARALGRKVGIAVLRVRLEHDEVGPVTLAVREAPGDPAVAAHDHERSAGQRHAGHAVLVAAGRVDKRCAVPGVRDGDPEVHVVRQQRAAALRLGAGDRPVVAAERGPFAVERSAHPDEAHGVEHGLALAAGGEGRRGRRGPRGLAARVEDLRPRDRRLHEGLPRVGRVPLGPLRREELEQSGRQQVAHQAERRLLPRQLRLQREVHRQRAQQRVLQPPRRGLRAQREVLERSRAERREARGDTGRVGVEQLSLPGGQRRDGALRDGAQPQGADLAVRRQRGRAHQLGELSRRAPAQQVHLEEAFLRVQESGRTRDVLPALAVQDRHPARVALDRDGRSEAGQRTLPVEQRQAVVQAQVHEQRAAATRKREQDKEAGEEAPGPTARGAGTGGARRHRRQALRTSPSTGWRPPPRPSSPPRDRQGSSCGPVSDRRSARRRAGCRSGC